MLEEIYYHTGLTTLTQYVRSSNIAALLNTLGDLRPHHLTPLDL
jgi:hypothetical protein